MPLVIMMFWMGLYPKPFLSRMEPSVNAFISQHRAKYAASEKHVSGPPVQWRSLAAQWRLEHDKALAQAQEDSAAEEVVR